MIVVDKDSINTILNMYFLHLLAFIIVLFLYESQSLQGGFCGSVEKTSVLRICTEDRMLNTTTAYIDTIEAFKFRNTSCKCRILPSRNRANLTFRMINITQGSPLKFKIKGNVFDKLSSLRSVRIQENTKLKFITNTTRKQEGACLAIYQILENQNPRQEVKFSIKCKKVASRATTIETMPVSNSTSQVTGTMAPLSSISKSHTLSTKRSSAQTKVGLDSTDNRRSGILDSHSLPQGFCSRSESTQILRICTEDRMQDTTTVYIDTVGATKLRNISCECRISPNSHNSFLVFKMINITQGSPLKFEIKGKVLDKKTSSHEVRIEENTKLMFITNTTREQEGACLAIYTQKKSQEARFSIHCENVVTTTTTTTTTPTTTPTTTESTTESTTETIPVSNLTSQVTETMSSLSSISQSDTLSTQKQKSTAQTKVDPENSTDKGSNGILVPMVSGLLGLGFGLAIGFLGMFFCKRIRKIQMKDGSTEQINLAASQVVTESPRNKNIGETRITEQSTESLYNQIEYDVHAIGVPTSSENKNLSDNVLNCNSDYDHCGTFPAPQQAKDCTGEYSAIKSIVGQDEQASHQDEEDCSTYDSTVKSTTKHFQENNLYHHLSPNDVIVNKPDDT